MTAKVVKRYANRKLYDTERSCYVTLDDISMMIKAGDEVKVIDNKNGEDLTSVTLAQIIFETEKREGFMPLGLLRDLIQNRGGKVADMYRESVEGLQTTTQQLRDNAQAKAHDIKAQADRLRTNINEAVIGRPAEMVRGSQKALDDLQRSLEERVKGGVGMLGRELQTLRSKLSELEDKLSRD